MDGVDPVALLTKMDVPVGVASKLTGAVVLATGCALIFLWRQASMLTLFALAGVTARLWTYHRGYDDLIGVFLLLALGVIGLERQRDAAIAAFLVMGLTLWLPARLMGFGAGMVLLLAWIGCAVVLVRLTCVVRRREKHKAGQDLSALDLSCQKL
jgi:hypothetical protein